MFIEIVVSMTSFGTNSCLFPQVIQIMLGVYHVLMWYFLLLLYMGQIKGVFGTYEPLTYKMGTGLWGLTVSRIHLC